MNKAFLLLEGLPVIVHNLHQVSQVAGVKRAIIVVRPDELAEGTAILQKYEATYFPELSWQIIAGGRERQDSVFNALCLVQDGEDFVAVHDGARPFATPDIFARVFEAAQISGAAVAGVPVKDTTKLIDAEGKVITTLERSKLRAIQTPQIFRTQLLKQAYEMLQREKIDVTDDAGAVELFGRHPGLRAARGHRPYRAGVADRQLPGGGRRHPPARPMAPDRRHTVARRGKPVAGHARRHLFLRHLLRQLQNAAEGQT